MKLNLYKIIHLYYPEKDSNGLEYLKSYGEIDELADFFLKYYKGKDIPTIKLIEEDDKGGALILDVSKELNSAYESDLADKRFIKMKSYSEYDIDNSFQSPSYLNEINNEAIVSLELNKLNLDNYLKIIGYGRKKINYPEFIYKENANAITDIIIYPYLPGLKLDKFLLKHDYSKLMHVLRQIIYALYEANTQIGFTHNDLHLGNVIVEPANLFTKKKIEYKQLNKKIETNQVVYIIDYGSSYVDTAPTGREWAEAGQHMSSWWVHDIVKIFMMMYKQIYDLKNPQKQDNEMLRLYGSLNLVMLYTPSINGKEIDNPDIEYLHNLYDEYKFNTESNTNNLMNKIITKEKWGSQSIYIHNHYWNLVMTKLDEIQNKQIKKSIDKYNENKEYYDNVQSTIESILSFFTFIIDENGKKGTLDDIMEKQIELNFMYFQVPIDIAEWNPKNTDMFKKFVDHFDKLFNF